MLIHGLAKTTLLDYPGHIACTIFLGGCNFLCPFCHNKDLVINVAQAPIILEEEVFNFLIKRRDTLEAVCITGGEPTLRKDLPQFISRIKELGYKVKLDTNGTNPNLLKVLCANGLLDYVAMDIKNSFNKYSDTVDVPFFDTSPVLQSIDFLLANSIPYEFRTTVVKELHTKTDIIDLSNYIKGPSNYFLQSFVASQHQIKDGFTAYPFEELSEILNCVKINLPNTQIRGF